MRQPTIRILFAAQLCFGMAVVMADEALTVHATEANIQITPRDPGQLQTVLPALDIAVVAQFNCTKDGTAESLTVSVADTHVRFGSEEIADTTSLEASLRVPATQIAPIAATGFCIKNSPPELEELIVPGVASAQVSLRCHSARGPSVHFASVSLPLRLDCESDESQESSPDK